MTLREAARAAVLAYAAGDMTAHKLALLELERLTSEDGPMPPAPDLVGMCKSILLDPYGLPTPTPEMRKRADVWDGRDRE